MNLEPSKFDDLRAIFVRLSDGALEEKEALRLNELLLGDPDACELYLNHMALEAQLVHEVGGAASDVPLDFVTVRREPSGETSRTSPDGLRRTANKKSRWRLTAQFISAAAVLLVGIGCWFLWNASRESPSVATVLLAEDCVWKHKEQVKEGSRLTPGFLRLEQGLAIVRLDGGAEVVLRDDTELELRSAVQARLNHGSVVVRSIDVEVDFKLQTPASELTDLGNEFAVTVDHSGATEVHVLDGEVAYQALQSNAKLTVLNAGQALRFEHAKQTPRLVSLNTPSYSELIEKAAPRERRDLMTVYEGFQYDEGNYEPSEIRDGKGWSGPWRLRRDHEIQRPDSTDTNKGMSIVHGQLQVPWPVAGGSLGMLELPAGWNFRIRPMSKPIHLAHDNVTYFSLMTHEPEHSSSQSNKKIQEGVRLTFRSSADYWGESLSFGIDQRLRPKIMTSSTGAFISPASIADEQSLLWIGKIISRASGEDEISLRIYGQADPLDFAEPAVWHCSSRGLDEMASLDLVVISSTGTSRRIVDELRIGPTWRSVVPIRSPKTQEKK